MIDHSIIPEALLLWVGLCFFRAFGIVIIAEHSEPFYLSVIALQMLEMHCLELVTYSCEGLIGCPKATDDWIGQTWIHTACRKLV